MHFAINPVNLLDKAGALYNRNRLSEARDLCARLLSTDPGDIKALLLMAMIERRRGRFDLAIDLARRILRAEPRHTEAHLCLAAILRDAKNPLQALDHITQVLRSRPSDLGAYMIASAIHFDLGNISEAEHALRRAIKYKPSAEAYLALGNLQRMQRNVSEAEDCFRRALQLSPGRITPWTEYASVHRFGDQDPELLHLAGLAHDSSLSADERNSLKFALADVYDRMERYEDAFRLLQEANQEIAKAVSYDAARDRRATLDMMRGYQSPALAPMPDAQDHDHVPIFIVAPSRSGKSLIESLLERDRGVIALREFDTFQVSFEQVLRDAGVKDAYFLQALARIDPGRIGDLISNYVYLVRNFSPDANYSINTSPIHNRYVGLILDVMPRAKVIICRRNALDCCLRMYFQKYKIGNHHSYDLAWLAEYYTNYTLLLNHWRDRYGDRILEVQYEDLVINPNATMATVRSYCGLSTRGSPQAGPLDAGEIGHWRNYEPWLKPLIDKLPP